MMAQTPDIDPIDRREQVRVDQEGGYVRKQGVVRDAGLERQQTLNRVSTLIWLIFGVIIGLIAIRVVLKLIVANPQNTFADFIYSLTNVFLWPFFGLTNTSMTSTGMTLEISSIIGMVIYALVAWVIVLLVRTLFSKSSARKVETYEKD
jgi:uncharacterized membrane protein